MFQHLHSEELVSLFKDPTSLQPSTDKTKGREGARGVSKTMMMMIMKALLTNKRCLKVVGLYSLLSSWEGWRTKFLAAINNS